MLVKHSYRYTLSVPQHRELGVGLLRKLLKQAGLTTEDFNNL
jgi:predicted RNA binding protein YcfA (HicA-like mRNA interferase family)